MKSLLDFIDGDLARYEEDNPANYVSPNLHRYPGMAGYRAGIPDGYFPKQSMLDKLRDAKSQMDAIGGLCEGEPVHVILVSKDVYENVPHQFRETDDGVVNWVTGIRVVVSPHLPYKYIKSFTKSQWRTLTGEE